MTSRGRRATSVSRRPRCVALEARQMQIVRERRRLEEEDTCCSQSVQSRCCRLSLLEREGEMFCAPAASHCLARGATHKVHCVHLAASCPTSPRGLAPSLLRRGVAQDLAEKILAAKQTNGHTPPLIFRLLVVGSAKGTSSRTRLDDRHSPTLRARRQGTRPETKDNE